MCTSSWGRAATASVPRSTAPISMSRWASAVGPPRCVVLLANADGKVNQIEAQDGAVLTSPFSFELLYGHYGNSWRVPSNQSMLSPCASLSSAGIPKKPFFANDLNPQLAKGNRAICMQAGVKEGPLLDACTIDVAVIGGGAAKVFAGMPAPVAVGDTR